jgi:hypothetical protein
MYVQGGERGRDDSFVCERENKRAEEEERTM